MHARYVGIAAAAALLAAITAGGAQKRGGILRMCTPDSPAGMSVPRDATVFSQGLRSACNRSYPTSPPSKYQ